MKVLVESEMEESVVSPGGRMGCLASGFSRIELLSVLAVAGVLLSLFWTAIANTRIYSRKLKCEANLREVALGIELYTKDTGKRPRSLSRVIAQEPRLRESGAFVCPSDPGRRNSVSTNQFWGNYANASQEPWAGQSELRDPESGSWTAELAEVKETEPFSYLHPLSWRRMAWQRLAVMGPETGVAVCQLHGVHVPANSPSPNYKLYLQYEGRLLRAGRDGTVSQRRIFRPGVGNDGVPGADYPWEFYTDILIPMAR